MDIDEFFRDEYEPRVDKKTPPSGMLKLVKSPSELEKGKEIWVDYTKITRWGIANHNNEKTDVKGSMKNLVKMKVRDLITGYDSVEGYNGYRSFLVDAVKRGGVYVYKR